MKRTVFLGRIRYAGNFLTVMQGILLVVSAIYLVSQSYMAVWQGYPDTEHALTVNLRNVPEDRQDMTEQALTGLADREGLFLVRTDEVLLDDGSHGGWQVGVYGDPGQERDLTLRFLDCEILNAENLRTLLGSPDPESTLGVDESSIRSVGNIPVFRFFGNAVVRKLPAQVEKSGTVNGTYRILGFSPDADEQEAQRLEVLDVLSEAGGMTEEELLEAGGGSVRDGGLMGMILLVFVLAQIFLNVVFFLVTVMQNLGKQGRLALLGWTPAAFAMELLKGFLIFSAEAVPILAVFGYLLSGWNVFSPMLAGTFLAAAGGNVLLTGAELFLAAAVVLLTRPLDAIRGRIPKKRLYALGVTAYLALSAGLVFCGAYADMPAEELEKNAGLSERWQSVSGYQILSSISVGEDGESFGGGSRQLDRDLYDWYFGIADQDGVYLIHTEHYDRGILNTWKESGTYASIPEEPLWLFTMSPNYLESRGIVPETSGREGDGSDVSCEELLSEAEAGTRLYLLPSDLSKEEAQRIESWLRERDTKSISEGDIQTTFTREQKFAFAFYEPAGGMFTWSTDERRSLTAQSPVICVAAPENMKYTETEVLKVSGLSGYLKFADKETAERYTSEQYLAGYALGDNRPVFLAVQNYIDGIRKQLQTTIFWFGGVLLVLIVILTGLLLTLAGIYRLANREKMSVKKFLGYGTWQMYRGPLLLLVSLFLLQIFTVLAMESKFGVLLILLAGGLQGIIFVKYMAHVEGKQMLIYLKGE